MIKEAELVFCYKNCSSDQEKLLKVRDGRLRICKKIGTTRIVHWNSEMSNNFGNRIHIFLTGSFSDLDNTLEHWDVETNRNKLEKKAM